MPEYKVYLSGYQSVGVTVTADDFDAAIEEALSEGIPEICGHCSGWGQHWWREESEEWVPESVIDSAGDHVWTGSSNLDQAIIRELTWLRIDIEKSPADALKLIDTRLAKLRSGKP